MSTGSENPNGRCVLITGAAGFLGKYMVRHCLDNGYNVVAVDRNAETSSFDKVIYISSTLEAVDWPNILTNWKPQYVFHLAATASVSASVKDPYSDFNNAIPLAARLLHSLNQYCPNAKLIYFSSAAVYGNPNILPISEGSEIRPISPYGLHKYVTEQMIFGSGRRLGARAVVLRIFSAFGPGLKKQLFFELDKKIQVALSKNETAVVLGGTGNESRDFIYGADVASAALLAAEHDAESDFEVYNVASGIETTVGFAAQTYINSLQVELALNFDGSSRTGDPVRWSSDITKLSSLGFVPKYSLERGLKDYAEWMSLRRFNRTVPDNAKL